MCSCRSLFHTVLLSHFRAKADWIYFFSIAIWEVQWNGLIPRNKVLSCPVLVIWLCESVFQLLPLYACRVFLFLFSVVQNLIWRKSWQARTTQELSVQSKLSELDSACDMWEESWHLCQRWLSLHQLTCALISSLSESVFISSVIVSVLTFRWSKNNHFCSCWFLFHQAKLINRTRLNFHC